MILGFGALAVIILAVLVYRHIDRCKRQRNYIHEPPAPDERDWQGRFRTYTDTH